MTIERYRGFSLERNAHEAIEATPFMEEFSDTPVIPFRSFEDAKKGIDILWRRKREEGFRY